MMIGKNATSGASMGTGRIWVTLWSAGLFLLALRPIESFDTFWQLQSGKYLWQTGAFLTRDTFSLATDLFRMEHCWLHDLILYACYTVGGFIGLGLLKPLVIAACGSLLLWWSHRNSQPKLLSLPVLLLCLAASSDSWLVRPQLWTFLFGALYLVLLYLGREYGWRSWICLVPVMLLWANLHAACIFGFALLAAFGVGELWRLWTREISWRSFGSFIIVALLTFAASFVNPYGWRIPLGQLSAHFDQTKVLTGEAASGLLGNMEWLPPTWEQVSLFYLVMAIWGTTVLWRLFRRRLDVAELVFFLGFSYMGFSQIRHTTLVALMAGFFLPGALQSVLPNSLLRSFQRQRLASLLGVVVLVTMIAWTGFQGRLGVGLAADTFPVAATDFVTRNKPAGNLYNAYDWGGYLMWRLYPDYLVFVDGRSTSPHYFDASSQIENRWAGWQSTLDDENVNLIITRTCFYDTGGPQNLIDGLARDARWALVFQDEVAVVYVRRSAENAALIRQYGLPNHLAYRTMLAEATRLQHEGYDRPRTWLALGRAHFGLGERAAALSAFRRYLQTVPDDREAQLMVRLLSGGQS